MKPKIFIFCNSCEGDFHSIRALAEDGCFIAGHVCTNHGFIAQDMGLTGTKKHYIYSLHYPNGYELIYVENPKDHLGLKAAYETHKSWDDKDYKERMFQAFE